MKQLVAAITGHKVLEDDFTRWAVWCYECRSRFGEPSINPKDLEPVLEEHLNSHE